MAKKMSAKEYEKYVRLGKKLLREVEAYQIKIAEYATKVCEIRHGGYSNGFYTIKDYAQDIQMPYKTLQNWVQVYRNVVQKVDITLSTAEDWAIARKTNDVLRNQTTAENKAAGTNNTRRTIRTPKARVKKIFNQIKNDPDEKPILLEITRMTANTKHTLHRLKALDLKYADRASLIFMMEKLDEASEVLNKFLTATAPKRKRAKGKVA